MYCDTASNPLRCQKTSFVKWGISAFFCQVIPNPWWEFREDTLELFCLVAGCVTVEKSVKIFLTSILSSFQLWSTVRFIHTDGRCLPGFHLPGDASATASISPPSLTQYARLCSASLAYTALNRLHILLRLPSGSSFLVPGSVFIWSRFAFFFLF